MARRYSIHPDSAAATSRTVSSTYTNGFLTGITGYAGSISYHPNGQVNQIVRANGTTDTYSKDPQNQLRPNKIDTKVTSTGAIVWSEWQSQRISHEGSTEVGTTFVLRDDAIRWLQQHTRFGSSTDRSTTTAGGDCGGGVLRGHCRSFSVRRPPGIHNRKCYSGESL